jgi:DNA-binding NtrC family response regulator
MNGTVLLVDDDRLVRNAYRRLLAGQGYDVRCAEDAQQAARALQGVDVVVSDVSMPRISGTALLRAIHDADPELPVILFTGWPSPEAEDAAADGGALRYLLKPVSPHIMEEAVAEGIALRRLALLRRQAARAAG